MSQLWDTFSQAMNNTFNISRIMDTWTRQMGYPVVTVQEKDDHYILHQERFLLNTDNTSEVEEKPNPYGYKWYIPFTYLTEEDREQRLVWLNLGSATIPKPKRGWLLGNCEFKGFFRVMYEKEMWGKLAEQLLKNHTKNHASIDNYNDHNLLFDFPSLMTRYPRRLILSLACEFEVEKAVSYAKSMFDNWMKLGHPLPADLAMTIYSVGIKEGGAKEWDFVWNKAKTTVVASERDILLESLVHTQKSWLLYRTPLSKMVALEYVTTHWTELVTKFEDEVLMQDIVREVTSFVNIEYHYKQVGKPKTS
ncbi:aminopeptidase, partial [Plakobranchus ocellatus]